MAKVKIKIGENEVEVDSRDFYVDNQSIGQIITDVSKHLMENSAGGAYDSHAIITKHKKSSKSNLDYLKSLDDAEIHEPEFNSPVQIEAVEIKAKLETLEKNAFFNKPRTVSDIVDQLHEYGWIASPLDVSKTLTKMVFHRELAKNSQNRNYYSIKEKLLAS